MIKSLFKCMYSHRLLVVGMILAPKSRCSVPGSFEDETLLICIIYIQEKVHQSIPNADTGLPWCTWCWNSSLVYSFNIKLQVSGSSWSGGVVWPLSAPKDQKTSSNHCCVHVPYWLILFAGIPKLHIFLIVVHSSTSNIWGRCQSSLSYWWTGHVSCT